MKPLILSVRSSQLDDLPAAVLLDVIQWLQRQAPSTPITLCFENEAQLSLSQLILAYQQKLETDTEYTINEMEHHKSVFWLLKTVQTSNIHFQSTLPCEDNISTTLKHFANTRGGIVLDFGHIQFTSKIQKKLPSTANVNTAFFCAYSHQGQYHHSPNFRLMRFAGVPKTLFPEGLQFLTTNLSEESSSEWKHERLEQLEKKRVFDKLTAYLQCYLHTNTSWQTKVRTHVNVWLDRITAHPKLSLKSLNAPW